MAAQERARLSELKEKESKLAAENAARAEKEAAEKAAYLKAEQERILKAKSLLRSAADHALEDKQDRIMRELEGKKPAPVAKAGLKSPPEAAFHAAPPPFEAANFTPQVHQNTTVQQHSQPQPPSFDFVEQQLKPPPQLAPAAPTAPSPSAPDIMNADFDHLEGVLPVALPPPPPTQDLLSNDLPPPPPPSFAAFEQQQQQDEQQTSDMDDSMFAYDDEGNPLSSEQRKAMMDEQRLLYEQIMKEKAANDAAIAQASADAFDSRSSTAAVKAMESHTKAMDSVGRVGLNGDSKPGENAVNGEEEEDGGNRRNRRMVQIGNNQTVALHGQDRTKKAIKEGTAILVQCINCQNWMQVTETATLMFCPVCQVVSPVIKQNEVMTKEEAIQLTMDRKLAEKLQQEAYASEHGDGREDGKSQEGYFAKLFGGGGSTVEVPAPTSSAAASTSWWDKVSSIVSYGVEKTNERGDIGVSRPPGSPTSASYPGERREVNTINHSSIAHTTSSSPTHHEETRGLLRPVTDGNEANLPAGRVAEQKPLFSCVYDSVSNAASSVFSAGTEDEDGNVYGVDSSSLLVTNAGRGVGDGAGNYNQLPDDE